MGRWLVWIALLASCDFALGLKKNPPDAMPDAAIDAAVDAFDTAGCPTSYMEIPGLASRYRFVSTMSTFFTHRVVCRNDAPMRTHLAVLDTLAEGEIVQAAIDSGSVGGTGEFFFVGARQQMDQLDVDRGWTWIVELRPVEPAHWAPPNEPQDGNGVEDNQENHAAMRRQSVPGLYDLPGGAVWFAICECDGKDDTE